MSKMSGPDVGQRTVSTLSSDQIQSAGSDKYDLDQTVLAVVKQHSKSLHQAFSQVEPQYGLLNSLEEALSALGLTCADAILLGSDDGELQKWLGTVLVVPELESSNSRYSISAMTSVLEQHASMVNAIFSLPNLALTLGVTVAGPALYQNFLSARDKDDLGRAIVTLEQALSPASYARWQELAAASLFAHYQSFEISPPLDVYGAQTKIFQKPLPYETEQKQELARRLFVNLCKTDEPIPSMLWELIRKEDRSSVASAIPLKEVLAWMNRRLTVITQELQECKRGCDLVQGDNLGTEMQESFKRCCAQVVEFADFVVLFFPDKWARIENDPIVQHLIPTRITPQSVNHKGAEYAVSALLHESHHDGLALTQCIDLPSLETQWSSADTSAFKDTTNDPVSCLIHLPHAHGYAEKNERPLQSFVQEVLYKRYERNPAGYVEEKLQDYVSRELGDAISHMMEALCGCMSQKKVPLTCSYSLAQSVSEMLEEVHSLCATEAVSEQRNDLYIKHLLPSFERALEVSIHSALALRLLFPPDNQERPTTWRFLVDDFMKDHQAAVLQAVGREAAEIARAVNELHGGDSPPFPEERVREFQRILRLPALKRSVETEDSVVLFSLSEIVRSLILWDDRLEKLLENRAKEQRSSNWWKHDSESSDGRNDPLRLFIGCRTASDILLSIEGAIPLQKKVMQHILDGSDEAPGLLLKAFICHANLQVVEMLEDLKKNPENFDSYANAMQKAYPAVFAARRLHRAAAGSKQELPDVVSSYLDPILLTSYQVRKGQRVLACESTGSNTVNLGDLQCVHNWVEGIVGTEQPAYKQQLLSKIFDFVASGQGTIPSEARSLLFEAAAFFAEGFAADLKESTDSKFFKSRVSYLLGVFFVSSPLMTDSLRVRMAKPLATIFGHPHATALCGNEKLAKDMAQEFQELAVSADTDDMNKAVKRLLESCATQALQNRIGLGS